MTKKFLNVLNGATSTPPPIWMMRQAGRYLPEYKQTRAQAGSFLDLCYNPKLAAQVTLQPIERFGFDAAILFSDILVIPDALGRDLAFEEGVGPIMTPIEAKEIASLKVDNIHNHLNPVYEAIGLIRSQLDDDKALIGFCGAPWTVATYMIAGRGSPDQAVSRQFAYTNSEAMEALINCLVQSSANYLIAQIEAGVDVVQIFDTWAGILDEELFEKLCVNPVKRIVELVRAKHPTIPIIAFPRGAALRYDTYRQKTGVTALGLDWSVPMAQAKTLQANGPIQGNLDPMRLLAGGKALDEGVDRIMSNLSSGPLIFNLGHGITPPTPIAHVEQMVKRVRSYDSLFD